MVASLEARNASLESELKERAARLSKYEQQVTQYKDTMRHFVLEDEAKANRIDELEDELADLDQLQQVRLLTIHNHAAVHDDVIAGSGREERSDWSLDG